MSTLADIRTKVRRLTGRPSPQQITDDEIDEYINTFYLYDMPETLRLITQSTTFEFMTEANVDVYDMRTMQVFTRLDTADVPVAINVNAVDYYINIKPPVYMAGYQGFWSQDNEQFFRIYPKLAEISTSTVGTGITGPYTVTLSNIPLLQNSVTVGAIDSTGAVINCVDIPTDRTTGTWQIINSNTAITGAINYLTGVLTVTFGDTIPAPNEITFTGVPYQPNRPQALLFYDNKITLRPVPDRSYLVSMNAYRRPTQLLAEGDNPELRQWWQYLSFGCAKKIFEDSQDTEGLNSIMGAFKEQERLVLRRTIVDITQQRTATIYTEQSSLFQGNFQNRF